MRHQHARHHALIITLCVVLTGCAAKGPLAKAQVGALTATEIVKGIDAAETQAYEAKLYDEAKHKVIGGHIATLADATLAYVTAVEAWTNTGQAGNVETARQGVLAALNALEPLLPPSARTVAQALRVLMGGVVAP
jgi:hypothetical protein